MFQISLCDHFFTSFQNWVYEVSSVPELMVISSCAHSLNGGNSVIIAIKMMMSMMVIGDDESDNEYDNEYELMIIDDDGYDDVV